VPQSMTAVAGAIGLACALSLPAPAECPGTCLFDLNGVSKALQVGATLTGGSQLLAREGSARQQKLLPRLPDSQADLSRVPELQGFAARTAGPLNQALARAGFGIRVSPWVDDGKHLGVVALLKVAVRWRAVGEIREVNGKQPFTVARGKPAFRLTNLAHGVRFGTFAAAREPVVIVPTVSGDKLYLLRTDDVPADPLALLDLAAAIARTRPSPRDWHYDGVYIPMVNADRQVDLSWMNGIRVGSWEISQSLQEVRFQMDQFGATVESGTVFTGPTGPPPTYYRLDGPFMAVIARAGVRTPIFAGYIGLDSFGASRLSASRPSAPDARAADASHAQATPPRPPVEEDEEVLRVGGAVTRPEKISAPPPVYTEMARRTRQQGVVILEVIIDRNGKVKEARVLKGMPMGLDRAALEAVQKWKFEPATLERRPVAVYYTLTVPFHLE
jgi:TonB family protein